GRPSSVIPASPQSVAVPSERPSARLARRTYLDSGTLRSHRSQRAPFEVVVEIDTDGRVFLQRTTPARSRRTQTGSRATVGLDRYHAELIRAVERVNGQSHPCAQWHWCSLGY